MILDNKTLFSKVFLWLFVGLTITFGVGYVIQNNDSLINMLFVDGRYMFIWLVQLVLAIVLSMSLHKMSGPVASVLYIIYTALMGVTFSTIFISYKLTSIIFVFGITAVVSLIFGLLGYKTKFDLSKIGSYLMMAILALIILSVLSVFIKSVALNFGLIAISLIIFLIYIAYDVQMIKRKMYYSNSEQSLAIYGAFQLYLDIINVFIDLLRIFGKER